MAERAPDSELIDRARAGDDAAFESLVRRHESAVAGVVVRMLGPGDEADDVGQETFIRFYRALDRFRGDAAVATYLVRIAMNLSLNALKRRKRERSRLVRMRTSSGGREGAGAEAAEIADRDPGARPDAAIEIRERAEAVHRALDQLDGKHRAVVVLRMMEGRSTRETAAILDIPEGTVMSRLKRSLTKLGQILQPLIEGGGVQPAPPEGKRGDES